MREPLRGAWRVMPGALLGCSLLVFMACGEPVVLDVGDTGGSTGGGSGDVGGGSGDGDSGGDEGTGDDGGGGGFVSINEFMASNGDTLETGDEVFPDWIELYNPRDSEIDLDGWTITDDLDEPDKHTLSGLSIVSGGHLLLYADGDPDQGPQHLGFSLDAGGEAIGLYNANGDPMDRLTYEAQQQDISAARVPDGSLDWLLVDDPTPGESNGDGE